MSTVRPKVSNRVINSFWSGPITNMERLCIKSYIDHGHEFHLFSYEPLVGLPVGTVLEDANRIVSYEQMQNFATPQQFSDHFRYVLLFKKGGWYMDMDTVCLRPFDFKEEYVFALVPTTRVFIYNGFLKVPPSSDLMAYCVERTSYMNKETLGKMNFQELGPPLITQAIFDLELEKYIVSGDIFDPVHWDRAEQIIDPTSVWDLSKSYCVHLFHAMWNNGHEATQYSVSPDTNGTYSRDCLYERLKRRYLVAPKVSIVITTFNRPQLLRKTLASIVRQAYKDFEIIVVDDGTDTETKDICNAYGAEYIKLRDTAGPRNPAYPNNVGVRIARGEIIILQNAECEHIDPQTIEKLSSAITDNNVVFARVISINQNGTVDCVYCGPEAKRPFFFCGAIKKSWFEKLRGIDEDYPVGGYEDDDWADRLKKEGVQFVYSDVEVHHQWHSRAGMPSANAAFEVYQRKTAEMANGRISTVRNLDKEWGKLGDDPVPVPVAPVVIEKKLPKSTVGGLRYYDGGLRIDWWDSHSR